MNKNIQSNNSTRTVALCYVRQSQTRDENDRSSPERQRANIKAICEKYDWTPEWYEDADGHKSGTSEKNRPGWLALKQRIGDPDIAALVGNDLSRFHRKGWRVGELLELIQKYHLLLVLAGRDKHIDCSTPQGRAMAQLSAMFDEWYADDISQRSKDSINYRKKQGKTVGMIPFGTCRNKDGYLIRTIEGVWLLPDGSFQSGYITEDPPNEEAIWRGYADAAEKVLRIYAENRLGTTKIAAEMRENGWFYRNRRGHPVYFRDEDVRRIIANWKAYGGLVPVRKSKDVHPLEHNLQEISLNPDRAIFSIDLLKQVAEVRRDRTIKRPRGQATTNFSYPLGGLIYCAHCHKQAIAASDPRLKTCLRGKSQERYRHGGNICGSERKSVRREIIESQFKELLGFFEIKPEWESFLKKLSVQSFVAPNIEEEDLEVRKEYEINTRKKKREKWFELYVEGRIDKAKMEEQVSELEKEIAWWNEKSSEKQHEEIELSLCINSIRNIQRIWKHGNNEDRQGMAQYLIEEIVYDLDREEIVGLKLKNWVKKFARLRVAFHNTFETSDSQDEGPDVPHTGLEPVF